MHKIALGIYKGHICTCAILALYVEGIPMQKEVPGE